MTPTQERVITLMRSNRRRDLYEIGDAATNMKTGAGLFAVTYTSEKRDYDYLTWADVHALVAEGLIVERYFSCYRLAGPVPATAVVGLRQLRQRLGCTQGKVSDEAGVHLSTVSEYERGNRVSNKSKAAIEAWIESNPVPQTELQSPCKRTS